MVHHHAALFMSLCLDAFIDLVAAAEPVCVIEGQGVVPWPDGAGAVAASVKQICERRQALRSDINSLFGNLASPPGRCDATPWACEVCENAVRVLSNSSANGDQGGAKPETSSPTANPDDKPAGNSSANGDQSGAKPETSPPTANPDDKPAGNSSANGDQSGAKPETSPPTANPDDKPTGNCCERDKQCDVDDGTTFHKSLREVIERNAGFFWTSGRYFWFEIMSLAILGALTHQLVLFARAYAARRAEKGVWRPRESIRTLMHLVVAPIFALVIIWILSATNLVVVQPVVGEIWSNATVPIAFLLGLFPTLGYDVLRGLASGLFNRHFRDDERDNAERKQIPGVSDDPEDAPPSLFRLGQRIRRHATAVFR